MVRQERIGTDRMGGARPERNGKARFGHGKAGLELKGMEAQAPERQGR